MYRLFAIIVACLICSSSGNSFRYICNGILANGEERSDECGECSDEFAARWKNPNIPVVVDENPRPEGLSISSWRQVVNDSLLAWDVSGSALRFFEIEGESKREFGANDSLHEIFWITDKEEWRALVGSGEFGTLGATLPRYICGGDLGAKRVLFDADLVLNGMPHINWQVECNDDDCISIQTTLVHELGHFFGLDHPCLLCSTSVMSARAGFDITNPVYDDMEGVRNLYPSGTSGGFGYPCDTNDECAGNALCVKDGQNKYCTIRCENDDNCEQGSLCLPIEQELFCFFNGGANAGGRSEGESCENSPCAEPFVCAGVAGQFSCFNPCENNEHCKSKQSCTPLQDENLSLCVELREKAQPCDARALCVQGLFCVMENESNGRCRSACSESILSTSQCSFDETCRLFDDGVELCIPSQIDIDLSAGKQGFGEDSIEGGFGRDGKNNLNDNLNPSGITGCRAVTMSQDQMPWFILIIIGLTFLNRFRRKFFLT